MKIQKKFSFFVFLAILGYSALVFVGESLIWHPQLRLLVHDEGVADARRCREALVRELENLAVFVKDYAVWTDAFEFFDHRSSHFMDENFSLESTRNTQLAFVAFYDRMGRLVDCRYFENEKVFAHTEALPELSKNLFYWGDETFRKAKTGLIATAKGLFYAASMAVYRSDGSGVSPGVIVMGKRIDPEFQKKISTVTAIPLVFYDLKHLDPSRAAEFPSLVRSMDREEDFRVEDNAPEAITVYSYFKDIDGRPALLLASRSPKDTFWIGFQILMSSLYASLILSLFIAGTVWLFLYLSVTRPLGRLEKSFRQLYDLKPLVDKTILPVMARKDEIGSLTQSFVQMQGKVIESHVSLSLLNATLERKVQERTEELKSASDRLKLIAKVMEETSEGVVITDHAANILEMNEAFCRNTGFDREELLGKNPRILKSGRHESEFYRHMWIQILETGQWVGEVWNRKKDGEIFAQWLTINAIHDEEGLITHYVGISSDITKMKQVEGQLHQMAYYDALTKLPNRALFYERLDRALVIRKRYNYKTALLFLDLDRFKMVNDTLGHAAGDQLLIEVARRIQTKLRESDTVCRLGGDEFTVILERLQKNSEAARICEGIIDTLSQPILLQGREVTVGASIGVALAPEDDTQPDGLIRKADAAMYTAKEQGKGRYVFASREIEERNQKNAEIESRMRKAVDQGRFVVHYQPQVSVSPRHGHKIIGAEALVRWEDEDGQLLVPEQFMTIAEETGQIVALGRQILAQACWTAADWVQKGWDIKMGVNISVRQFEDPDFVRDVHNALENAGLDGRHIQLELTESLFLSSKEKVSRVMNELRALGITLAIDDFGVGYSTLSYLAQLPVDCLKIDKTFLTENMPGGEVLMTAILSLGAALGIQTVAEGVETPAQLELLKSRGCTEAQGFFFSPALDKKAFEKFKTDRGW